SDEGSVVLSGELGIVMGLVNILAGEVSQSATNEYIRGKVLLACHPGETHRGGSAIGERPGQPAGILAGENAGEAPCEAGVLRGERDTTAKEVSLVISLERAFAAKGMFEYFVNDDGVEHRLAGKDARLTQMVVRFETSYSVEAQGSGSGQCHSSVCNVIAEVHVVAATDFKGSVAVGHDQTSGGTCEGNEPARVFKPKAKGAGPDVLLVTEQVTKQVMLGGIRNIT